MIKEFWYEFDESQSDVGQVKMGHQKRRTDIQVMRGVAVLAVLLFHTRETWFTAGYLGVDVFFVISGFVVMPLIVRIFSNQDGMRVRDSISGLRAFYIRRFYRLAPALGVTLMFSLIVILLLGPVLDHMRFASQGLAALFLVGNFGAYHYSGGNYFAPNPNPLIHLWSLSAEEQIYLFLPIVIFLLLYITRKRRQFSFQLVILFLGVFAYFVDTALRMFPQILRDHGITDLSGLMFYSPVSRMWEFCIGSTAYFLSARSTKPFGRSRKYLNCFLTILLGVLLFLPINGYKFQTVVISILAAAVIYFRSFENFPGVLHRAGGWLGDRSYSIYLVHMPLLYVALYSPIFVHERFLATTISFALSIAVGAVIYQNIEERFRIKSTTPLERVVTFRTLFIFFVFIPILLFAGMRSGAEKHYWGLDPNPTPLVGGLVRDDPSCYLEASPCSYPAKKSIAEALLIGDSHAGAIFQTFAGTMNSIGVTAYGMQQAGCQFILRGSVSREEARVLNYSFLKPGYSESCFSHNDSIVRWIKSHPSVKVFISQRSSSIRPESINEEKYREIIFKNLIYLKEINSHLVVIGPSPEFPDPVGVFQVGLLIWERAYVPPKSFPISAMQDEPIRDNEFLSLNTPIQGIHFIDSVQLFCTNTKCTRFQNSNWLFYDSDHLTPLGASRLKLPIAEHMNLILGKQLHY